MQSCPVLTVVVNVHYDVRAAAERARGDGPPADSPPYTPSSLHSWGSVSAGGGEHALSTLGPRLPDIADTEHQDSCESGTGYSCSDLAGPAPGRPKG